VALTVMKTHCCSCCVVGVASTSSCACAAIGARGTARGGAGRRAGPRSAAGGRSGIGARQRAATRIANGNGLAGRRGAGRLPESRSSALKCRRAKGHIVDEMPVIGRDPLGLPTRGRTRARRRRGRSRQRKALRRACGRSSAVPVAGISPTIQVHARTPLKRQEARGDN